MILDRLEGMLPSLLMNIQPLSAARCYSHVTVLLASVLGFAATAWAIRIEGPMRQGQPVTITFDGPEVAEIDEVNPFLHYRLDVTFAQGDRVYLVPGYFAADGDAANTSADRGNRWRVHFLPPTPGQWTYRVSFRQGHHVAVSDDPMAGKPGSLDGIYGRFTVGELDPHAPGFWSQGLLQYVGQRYLRFSGSGRYFLKGGTDSPENFLGYHEFDQTPDRKKYLPHVQDWREGDPTWKDGKGKGIIGAVNYLGSKGVNSIYFLTNNVHPHQPNACWPWISPDIRDRYDVSKLDQWRIVFHHMADKGIGMHVVLQERQNDQMLDGGLLGPERRLYYRELIARFSHFPVLWWNLGEEYGTVASGQSLGPGKADNHLADLVPRRSMEELHELRKEQATFIRRLDPYDHPIVVHTHPAQKEWVYTRLLGFEHVEGPSLQHPKPWEIKKWIDESAKAGRPWVVTLDESHDAGPLPPGGRVPGRGTVGVAPDWVDPDHDLARTIDLWGTLMSGGAGVEWYFGHQYEENDLTLEDFRSRDRMWDQTRHALTFFHQYLPFHRMHHADRLAEGAPAWVLAAPGEIYAVYIRDPGEVFLDLSEAHGRFTVHWYNPKYGGELQEGSVTHIDAGEKRSLGSPPPGTQKDWAILIRKQP